MDQRSYQLPEGMTVEQIGHGIEGFLRNQKKMTVEGARTQNGYFIQAKTESDGWKKISGMDQALQIQLGAMGAVFNVQIDRGSWSSKVGAGVVGAFVFAPLAVTAGVGAYKASKLPGEIFAFVEHFLMTGGVTYEIGMEGPAPEGQVACPKCGAMNAEGTKFCGSCGAPLGNVCPSCGSFVPGGTKFCPECGTSLVANNVCPKCGAEVSDGQKFCPECGMSLA